jgi:hypothetical protein
MADDFIVEEESSNRTFIYAVAGMGAIFVIGLIIVVIMILTGGNGNGDDEVAIMNQTIEAENRKVTLTVAHMETVAAYTPTFTPSPPPATYTAIPSFTPSPIPPTLTPTPLLQTPEGGEGAAAGPEATVPPEAGVTPTVGPEGPGGGQLPASGLGMWGAVIGAAALVVVIFVARWFRPAA